ncbi:MAG: deoxyribodipyrimidine photo-lyase [Hyphomicrobiales bacterium]|nr:deoxyribodipyrimidine photo-lyase [Hyphomicrobiales bacterium]
MNPILVWLRQDLRLADHPALAAACGTGAPVVPVYILDDETPGPWAMGGASRWWLHGSLQRLAQDLSQRGAPLVLRRGRADQVLCGLARECGAAAVYWNRHVEPYWRDVERELEERLTKLGLRVQSFSESLLFDVGRIVGQQGKPFRVFTPFWRACQASPPPASPLAPPKRLRGLDAPLSSDPLDHWRLRPSKPDWAGGLRAAWTPGENGAQARLDDFLNGDVGTYKPDRNRPEPSVTSGLSPHLHFGEISLRQVWHAAAWHAEHEPASQSGIEAFLREIGWREFYANVLVHEPASPDKPLQERFSRFPWASDRQSLLAWQRGRTGYPIVDAGMRQLWQTGWMHNRVRMIVASFLIKDLLIPWQDGEHWFWDTLVDADLANNAGGWQWVAGCGTDAAPYFRIFNPVSQGEKFDSDGAYVRRWVPELARLPDRWIHKPWQMPPLELQALGVHLGETYPQPIVDHAGARQRALAAYQSLKSA